MAIDIIGYISSQVTNLTNEQKAQMLDDYVSYYHYDSYLAELETGVTPLTKKEFANKKIVNEIKSKVESVRRDSAVVNVTYENLELE